MSNLIMWSLIVGFISPMVIAVVQQPRWSDSTRAIATVVLCILFGAGTAYFNDQFNLEDVVGSILTVGVASITFYKGVWKKTGVAPAIERATSPNRLPPTAPQAVHNLWG